MSLRRSADLGKGLLWAGLAVAGFFAFRAMQLHPFFAILASLGALLLAAVVWRQRERLATRSLAFVLVGVVAWLFAWNRGVPFLYAFSAACFAIVAVSHALPRWALRAVNAHIYSPGWIRQEDAAALSVEVGNPSASSLRVVELEIPFEGALARGEPLRTVLVRLAPGASRTLDLRTAPLRRGRHRIGPVTVTTGFPLGLATKSLTVPQSQQHLWVYPRLFQAGFVPIAGEQFQSMGEAISPRAGGAGDFAGVREYRHGDNRRHIHWRASARRGELVVKEFMRTSATTVTVALDLGRTCNIGRMPETAAEYGIRIAGSIARYALERGHYVQLALCGRTLECIGPVSGIADLERIQRALALAEADGDGRFGQWLPRVAALAPPDSTAVLIHLDANAGAMSAMSALTGRGVLVVPVVLEAVSFGAAPRPASPAPGAGLRARERRVRRGADLAELFRS